MLDVLLVAVGLLGLVVAGLSEKMRSLPISEPLLALVAGALLGPHVLGALDLPSITEDPKDMHEGTRLLLAVSVMAVALRYPVSALRSRVGPVVVLLLVALPVMAAVSAGLVWAILGVPFALALLVGAAVAPTDPVLASSVVTGDLAERDLPVRDRQLLSLESGANDGLALPVVLAAVAVAGATTGAEAAMDSLWQVASATVIGLAFGWVGGKALALGEEHGAVEHGPILLFTVVLALAVMGLSGLVEADGVFAVFVAGLTYNHVSTSNDRTSELSIDEAVNRFAVLPLFLVLGAMLPWGEWRDLGWSGLLLAAAVLLLRRLPILLLLAAPLGLRLRDALFLGWFGPIGVSALFYLTMEADRLQLPPVVMAAGSLVVVASTVVHGTTAAPGRVLYARTAAVEGKVRSSA